jgi:hypothetical protein
MTEVRLTTLPGQGLADVKVFPKAKSLMKPTKLNIFA